MSGLGYMIHFRESEQVFVTNKYHKVQVWKVFEY